MIKRTEYHARMRLGFVMISILAAAGVILGAETGESAGHGAAEPPAELLSVESLIALLTLTGLEIVLGIDNVIFIAILSGKLPKEKRGKAQKLGIAMAVGTRILLLLCL